MTTAQPINETLQVESFESGAFIELDDPRTGKRRLGIVAESGTEFYDYIDFDAPPTPLAILNALDPQQWGDCRALAADLLFAGKIDRYQAFNEMLLALCDTDAGADPLTLNRAAKWAYEMDNFDVHQAAAAGLQASAEARERQAHITASAALLVAAEG